MRRLVFSWACIAACALALPLHAQKDQRETPEVRKLKFEGVAKIDAHDLGKSISTRASKCRNLILMVVCLFSHSPTIEDKFYLDHDELARDITRNRVYYWKRGYRETSVDTVVTKVGDNKAAVTFKVTEGPATLVRKVAIAYDSTLISDKVRNRLTLLHARDPLNLVLLDSMRVAFQNELWDLGFGDAVVDTSVVVNQPAYLADVGLTLTPNRRTTIGRVTIGGNSRVDESTIRNTLAFEQGDLYRQSTVLESQRNLYESNLFRLATIYVPPQPYDSVKNVNVDVTEAPLHEARVGPGLSNIDFVQFQAHYTSYNLFGGARRLDIDGTVGNLLVRNLQGRGIFRDVRQDVAANIASAAADTNVSPFLLPTYNASIDFRQPAFLRRPADAAGIGGFAHRTQNPGVFVDNGYGGQVTLTHQIKIRAPASVNYRYELNRVHASDTYFCVNYGVCDTLAIGTLRSHQAISPLTLTGFVDRSDLPFSPTKGYVARLDFEHASGFTLSDYRYNRAFLDAAVYGHKSGTERVYSAHLRVGFVRPLSTGPDAGVLHPRKRFYAGGANSVRGYGESQLGPRILTIEADSLVKGAASIGGGTCAATMTGVKFCDPNTSALPADHFTPQPLGGTSLLEGSVEYRVPLPLPSPFRHFVGALFIDGGIVGGGDIKGLQSLSSIIKGTGAITPGVGLRYASPVGPIRVDIALNPNRAEELGVVTSVRDASGVSRIVPLAIARHYVQGRTLLDRLSLHFSIGEAY
jgi:outer membrane protein insertion porin family